MNSHSFNITILLAKIIFMASCMVKQEKLHGVVEDL